MYCRGKIGSNLTTIIDPNVQTIFIILIAFPTIWRIIAACPCLITQSPLSVCLCLTYDAHLLEKCIINDNWKSCMRPSFSDRIIYALIQWEMDDNPSLSTTAVQKYFPLFNPDLPRHLKGSGRQSKARKLKKLIPPASNYKITDHFSPARTNSKRRDDENIHLVRSPGCQR